MERIFKIGEVYSINTKNGDTYQDAEIVGMDDDFVKLHYHNIYDKMLHIKILAISSIHSFSSLREGDSKEYFYWGQHYEGRWGFEKTNLSKEEYELNKANGVIMFDSESDAKEYLFKQAEAGLKSEYFVFGKGEPCALYYSKNGYWAGCLAKEYKEFAGIN